MNKASKIYIMKKILFQYLKLIPIFAILVIGEYCAFGVLPAFASQSFSDNFDSYSVGNIAGNSGGSGVWSSAWSNYSGTGNEVTTAQSNSSPNSMLVKAAGSYRNFTSDTSFDFFVEVYQPSSSNIAALYVGTNSSLSGYCDYDFSGGGNVSINGTSEGSFSPNTWVSMELSGDIVNGCRVAIGGGAQSSYKSANGTFSGIGSVVYICDNGSTCGYIDDISPTVYSGGGGGCGGGSSTSTSATSTPELVALNTIAFELLFVLFTIFLIGISFLYKSWFSPKIRL
jgi:hypothetical protein